MAIRCIKCGRFVEPTKEAMETQICGYCSGKYEDEIRECFDGSPCTRADQDCNKCEWMGKQSFGG